MARMQLLGLSLILFAASAPAGESRAFRPIPAPGGEGAPPRRFAPVDRRVIENAVTGLMRAWNTPQLRDWLDADYFDRTRLLDAIETEVPRDARLRVLAIEGIETLEQQTLADEGGESRPVRRSVVAVIVRTALEFNDPEAGFVRREGNNEYLFEVKEVLR